MTSSFEPPCYCGTSEALVHFARGEPFDARSEPVEDRALRTCLSNHEQLARPSTGSGRAVSPKAPDATHRETVSMALVDGRRFGGWLGATLLLGLTLSAGGREVSLVEAVK